MNVTVSSLITESSLTIKMLLNGI